MAEDYLKKFGKIVDKIY